MTKLEKPQVVLIGLLAVSLLAGFLPLFNTVALAIRQDEYSYLLLIIPISAALIFREWPLLRSHFSMSIRPGLTLLGTALLIACFAIAGAGMFTADVVLSIRILAIVVWWIGALVLCWGHVVCKRILFPLLFLFGLIPLPGIILDSIVGLLQQQSAWAATGLFKTFGIPVAQDGVFLAIPGLTLQVAPECSSIRSSSLLLITTLVLAQLVLYSPWRKAIVVLLSVPLAVAKNGLRIFALGTLATKVDPSYITGSFHHQGGVIFFLIALLEVFALLWILQHGDGKPTPLKTSPQEALEERPVAQ